MANKRGMTFQVTAVNKALASVSRMCEKGHQVVFDPRGSYIKNIETGETIPMRPRNGVWVLDVWAEKRPTSSKAQGFPWPGMQC